MKYPTEKEVEYATREQLGFWYRFLDSPGNSHIGATDFYVYLEKEGKIMDRICEKFKEMGMFTPELSKKIGWEK